MYPRLTLDFETYLIEPGQIIPKPVAGGMKAFNGQELIGPFPVTMDQACLEIKQAVANGWLLVGHNIFFDLAVAWRHDPSLGPVIWDALERGLVVCTAVREKLIKCAEGRLDFDPYFFKREPRFTLADLAKEYLGLDISEDKKNPYSWRLRFKELDGVPFEQWPEEAMRYMLQDVNVTDDVYQKQCPDRATQDGIQFVKGGRVTNEIEQAKAAWILLLTTAWGLITDKHAVDSLEIDLQTESTRLIEGLKQAGLVTGKGKKSTKAIRARVEQAFSAQGLTPPRTGASKRFPEGQTKMDADTLNETNDAILIQLNEYSSVTKLLDTFVRPVLRQGTHGTIHPNYDVLKATGRTSSYGSGKGAAKQGCNIQQLPRKGGVRECFIPRPGHVFLDCDYSTIELAALAQVTYSWFGYSAMRDYLLAGYDLHILMASRLLGWDYTLTLNEYKNGNPQVAEYRQMSKGPNFGYPGGMGPEKMVLYCRVNYGVVIDLPTAAKARAVWKETFPEVNQYLDYFSRATENPSGEFTLIQPGSGRVRGGVYYTSGANSCFQGLAADGMKEAMHRVGRECYLEPESDLYGTRIVAMIHDQLLCETPEEKAAHAGDRLSHVMVAGMQVYLPDVPVVAEPVLMRRWYKGGKTVRNEAGLLQVWEPSE